MAQTVPVTTNPRRSVCLGIEALVRRCAPIDRVACYVEQEPAFSTAIQVPEDLELLLFGQYVMLREKNKSHERFRVPLVLRHTKGTQVATAVAAGMPVDWPDGLANCVCVHPCVYTCVYLVFDAHPPTEGMFATDVPLPPEKSNVEHSQRFLTKHLRVRWSAASDPNSLKRKGIEVMEDRVHCVSDLLQHHHCHSTEYPQISYFGLFDGHHGHSAAEYLRRRMHEAIAASKFLPECLRHHPDDVSSEVNSAYQSLLTDTFEAIDEELKTYLPIDPDSQWTSGSTGCVALLRGTTLHVANVGDGRCIISRGGTPLQVTADHRVPANQAEVRRLETCGTNIVDHSNGEGYLQGMLQVSRAFGNFTANRMKLEGLIAKPDVFHVKLERNDEFMFIGCDGVFDKTRNTTINSKIRKFLAAVEISPKTARGQPVEEAPRETESDSPAHKLVNFFRRFHEAIDNISVIVLELHHVAHD